MRNPFSFRHWWTAIQNTKEASTALLKAEGPPGLAPEVAALLGPLASPTARKSLQRLTYLYEAALVNFPTSFKLWKSYLQTRMSYVLGKLVIKKRSGGRKKLPEMREALEDEKEDMEKWEGGLDGIVGLAEWRSLVATFERALMWLPKVCGRDATHKVIFPDGVLDAPNMVAIPFNLQPPVLPPSSLTYTCSTNVRSCPPHTTSFTSRTNMGPLSSLG